MELKTDELNRVVAAIKAYPMLPSPMRVYEYPNAAELQMWGFAIRLNADGTWYVVDTAD